MRQFENNKGERIKNFHHKVLHVIECFPCFEGYTGGGAERLLERLIGAHKNSYPKEYYPSLYVANKKEKDNNRTHTFVTIEDPEKTKLAVIIREHNHIDTILHFGNTYLVGRFPEQFTNIGEIWKGPIIQRVTLASRVRYLFDLHKEKTQSYLSRVSAFVSQSDQMSKELAVLGIPLSKIVQIENGIDTEMKHPISLEDKYVLRKKLFPKLKPQRTVYLFVGRLEDPFKKVDELLAAWKAGEFAARGHYLVLAGRYDVIANHFGAYINQTEGGVIFTGHLEEVALDKYFQAADVFVSASEREGFSNSMLEAMAWGVPVLGRRGVSGHEELIVSNITGLLFDTTKELKDRMLQLASSVSLRRKMGKNARTHVVKKYSIEHMVEKYRSLYIKLLNVHS